MKYSFDDNEVLLGRSRAIVKQGDIVKKYYWAKDHWDSTKLSVKLMKMFYIEKDFFIKEINHKDCYEVHTKYIDHHVASYKGYRKNVQDYLCLVESIGLDICKKDLQWYNLIYSKGDAQPYILDWDDYIKFNTDNEAYNFYKGELTQKDWCVYYNKSQEEINEIFEDEWRKVYSRFIS